MNTFTVPEHWTPEMEKIVHALSSDAQGRVDYEKVGLIYVAWKSLIYSTVEAPDTVENKPE